jgi:hypothetical protein
LKSEISAYVRSSKEMVRPRKPGVKTICRDRPKTAVERTPDNGASTGATGRPYASD